MINFTQEEYPIDTIFNFLGVHRKAKFPFGNFHKAKVNDIVRITPMSVNDKPTYYKITRKEDNFCVLKENITNKKEVFTKERFNSIVETSQENS